MFFCWWGSIVLGDRPLGPWVFIRFGVIGFGLVRAVDMLSESLDERVENVFKVAFEDSTRSGLPFLLGSLMISLFGFCGGSSDTSIGLMRFMNFSDVNEGVLSFDKDFVMEKMSVEPGLAVEPGSSVSPLRSVADLK